MSFDRTKSLTELEGEDWGAPTFDSYLVRTCHRLRNEPVGQLSVEDLRILLGQDIGAPFLVPLALERLAEDPLAEGDFYPGDLLNSVLGVDPEFYLAHPALRDRALAALTAARAKAATLGEEEERSFARATEEAAGRFLGDRGPAADR